MSNLARRSTYAGIALATVAIVGLWAESSAADENRRNLPLAKALVGHWRTHSGKAEYYFTDDGKLVMTENDGARQQAQTYEVVESDEDEDLLKLKVKVVETGGGHVKELRFAADRATLLSTVRTEIRDKKVVVNIMWHFVDGTQSPDQ